MRSLSKLSLSSLPTWAVIIIGNVVLVTATSPIVAVISGIIVILIMPGYLLVQVLWPKPPDSDRVWRLSLVIPASIALVSLILLAVNYLNVYNDRLVMLLITVLNAGLALGALGRRRCVTPVRPQLGGWLAKLDQAKQTYHFSVGHLMLALSFSVLVGAVGYAVATPRHTSPLTEFYVLTPEGQLPVNFGNAHKAEIALTVGIVNHENREVKYHLVVVAKQVNSFLPLWTGNLTVPDGATMEQPLQLKWPVAGIDELQLLLYLADSPTPYRVLRIISPEPLSWQQAAAVLH